MKRQILFFLLITLYSNIGAQVFYYEIGDTLTVLANSGVNLRESNSIDSKKIESIPFGAKVIANGSYPFQTQLIENRTGFWLNVLYKGKEGYLFTGFLSKLKIPAMKLANDDCYSFGWFEKLMRLNVDTLLCKGDKFYKGFDQDGKDWNSLSWEMFSDETEIYGIGGYEMADLVIETRKITMNDIINLLEYYIDNLNKSCPDAYFVKGNEKLTFGVEYERDSVVRIYASFDFEAEKSLNKTIIRLRLWDE